ncbi:MAG: hypothetical protein KC635_20165 [Myxococcales bacterium]|nr:hypothetical protein [Myxococcales bacterium]
MRRIALSFVTGLGLTLVALGCGEDTTGTSCGDGTHLENGKCVADNVTDTIGGGTDTIGGVDTLPGNDSTGGTDTLTPFDSTGTDTNVNTGCEASEESTLDVGAGCSKDCQCRQDLGLTCRNYDYYLPGFSFCTKNSDGSLKDIDGYVSLLFPSDCYGGSPQSNRPPLYQHICSSLDDCKALAAQYTHCGTSSFPWISGGAGTQCPPNDGGTSPGTLQTQKTCVIETLEPFVDE